MLGSSKSQKNLSLQILYLVYRLNALNPTLN